MAQKFSSCVPQKIVRSFFRRVILFLFFCVSLSLDHSVAQCVSPHEPPSDCEAVNSSCFVGHCFTSGLEAVNGFNGFCGPNTAIHNPQFFAFIAADKTVQITISVDSCINGVGLQSAVIGVCPWQISDVLACDPGTAPGGMMVLSFDAVPGEPYWLIVDGSSGANCSYSFVDAQGIITEEFIPAPDSATTTISTSTACPGQDSVLLTMSNYTGQFETYAWTTSWDGVTYETLDSAFYLDIPSDAPEGDWVICASILGSCYDSPPTCIEIRIEKDPAVLDTLTYCFEEFPFFWGDTLITVPGTYIRPIYAEDACTYDSIVTFNSTPFFEPHIDSISTCALTYQDYGQTFTESGVYPITLSEPNIFGCDSVVVLNLTILGLNTFVQPYCDNDQFTLVAAHLLPNPTAEDVNYTWYDCNFSMPLSAQPTFTPVDSSCYCLVTYSESCQDTICSVYDINACENPCSFVIPNICVNDVSAIPSSLPIGANANIYWILEDGTETILIQDQDTLRYAFTSPGIWSITLTVQDSSGTNSCQGELYVSAPPNIDLCCDQAFCASQVNIIITNSGGPADVVITTSTGGIIEISDLIGVGEFHFPQTSGDSVTYYISEITPTLPGCSAVSEVLDSVILIVYDDFPIPLELEVFTQAEMICPVTLPDDVTQLVWTSCSDSTVLANSACFSPVEEGCYCLEVTVGNVCSEVACVDYIIDQLSDIHRSGFRFYPNPVADHLTIETDAEIILPVSYSILSIDGKTTQTGVLHSHQHMIELSAFAEDGVFILQLANETGKWREKFVRSKD